MHSVLLSRCGILRSLAALMGPFVAGAWRTDVLVGKQKIRSMFRTGASPRAAQTGIGSRTPRVSRVVRAHKQICEQPTERVSKQSQATHLPKRLATNQTTNPPNRPREIKTCKTNGGTRHSSMIGIGCLCSN